MGLSKKERYRYLVDARNFHYESFNKWMTYFYVALGTLFVAYYSLLGKVEFENERNIVLFLGYMISLFWYWSSKGYYFWNVNFIALINDHELNELRLKPKRRIYSVFANKKVQNNYLSPIQGANISTSKVAILFSFMISIVWGTLLWEMIFENLCDNLIFPFYGNIIVAGIFTLVLTSFIPNNFLHSKIDHLVDLEINQDK